MDVDVEPELFRRDLEALLETGKPVARAWTRGGVRINPRVEMQRLLDPDPWLDTPWTVDELAALNDL